MPFVCKKYLSNVKSSETTITELLITLKGLYPSDIVTILHNTCQHPNEIQIRNSVIYFNLKKKDIQTFSYLFDLKVKCYTGL